MDIISKGTAIAGILTSTIICWQVGAAQAADNDIDPWIQGIAICVANGGTEIDQPPGSAITACCYDDPDNEVQFCYICDEYGEDCSMDIAEVSRPSGIRPALQPPAEVVAPVAPRVKPNRFQPVAPVAPPAAR